MQPFVYFGTSERPAEYKQSPGLDHATVFLAFTSTEFERHQKEFDHMLLLRHEDPQYRVYVMVHFLKAEWRSKMVIQDGRFYVQFFTQHSFEPAWDKSYWKAPPRVKPSHAPAPWTWDIQPDFTYWLTAQDFSVSECIVAAVTYVECFSASPYFTIEFENDTHTLRSQDERGDVHSPAVKRLAAAGAIALYNRFLLWERARQHDSTDWNVTPEETIRHFGLTVHQHLYTFWVFRPHFDVHWKWAGCGMAYLTFGKFNSNTWGLIRFADWINEIHRWGMTVHAPAVKEEVNVCLKAERPIRLWPIVLA
ncbi:hypothetical protein BDV95DRAFT_379477 [Massariosphaeria phaeospora]|uniref:Uncharacterized protein n=1 Tax=Massariosphaeria phaeospora TaxID=100035 RepID=A0A7C8I6Z2_9PLEO|nr:hypothetical protein BDV95DRAFT_379477 [Massariosphaeria phaeospora]